ncbi:MAG: hypothetical protein ACJ8HI_07010 [Massilia sp.]|jgi:hypothetical protein
MDIPLSRSDYFRGVAKEARIRTRNRYFEQNPILNSGNSAMLARMGMRRYLYVGQDGIRGLYSQPGSFNDAAFVASGDNLWRVDKNGTKTFIGAVGAPSPNNAVIMAATSNIGTTPAYLFVCGGGPLMLYMENGYARGTISGVPANTDVVQIGGVYYKFTNAGVNVGAPAGTNANPWLVALGVDAASAWTNLSDAIENSGTAGTQYSTALTANTTVKVVSHTGASVTVRATAIGVAGNTVSTTETGAAIAWGAATLAGGGGASWTAVETPDDVGVIGLAYIASYVVVVPAQGQNINGRFYWIAPGETTIDPLDYATAERAPDPISGVVVFGDQFWLPGSNTTEPWYFTGNIDQPVLRMQGVVFDRGAWEGTAVQVKDSMIIVDNEGAVFQIQGGAKRISRPDVEERIREAIQFQAAQLVI